MPRTTITVPPERQGRPSETVQEVVDHVFELPFDAQLAVVRTIVPKTVACLQGKEREAFMRELYEEIARAERGEPTYDVRPEAPAIH